jgi:hypothetical protein
VVLTVRNCYCCSPDTPQWLLPLRLFIGQRDMRRVLGGCRLVCCSMTDCHRRTGAGGGVFLLIAGENGVLDVAISLSNSSVTGNTATGEVSQCLVLRKAVEALANGWGKLTACVCGLQGVHVLRAPAFDMHLLWMGAWADACVFGVRGFLGVAWGLLACELATVLPRMLARSVTDLPVAHRCWWRSLYGHRRSWRRNQCDHVLIQRRRHWQHRCW